MPSENTFIETLADAAMNMRHADIPEDVRAQTRLCILDTIGCMLAGRDDPDVQLFHRIEAKDGAAQACAITASQPMDMVSAMRINGYAGDVMEMNDLIGGHAGIGNVTASLAIAQQVGASGAELIEAVVRGIEITSRVYSAIYDNLKPYTEVGISSVGVPSTIGVAAAASSLLKLDREATAQAMAIAASLANWCPAEVIFGAGGKIKPSMFGSLPAENGWRGAWHAKHGMTGPLRILESPMGYFPTMANAVDATKLREAPDGWYLRSPRRKLHACCGYIHSALDLLAKMRETHAGLDGVAVVEVGMPPFVIPAVSKTALPTSPSEARFHAEYCLALVAAGENVIGKDHSSRFESNLSKPAVRQWLPRIAIREDSALTHYHQCTITLRDADGRTLTKDANAAPKGSAANPLTERELIEKFRAQTPAGAATAIDAYLKKVQAMETFTQCDWLITDLTGLH